jgi:hypothetical protein
VDVGDSVGVWYDSSGRSNISPQFECTIAEVNNGWFRCATGDAPPGVLAAKRELVWYDMNHVAMIKKVVDK